MGVIVPEFPDQVNCGQVLRNPLAGKPASNHCPGSSYSSQAVDIDRNTAIGKIAA